MGEVGSGTGALLAAGSMALLVVHLAWVGLTAGVATVAVAMDALGGARHRRLASALLARMGPTLFTVAGLEVTATLSLVAARVAHPAFEQTGGYWAGVLFPLVAGLAALGAFIGMLDAGRWAAARTAVGLIGIGLVLASAWLLCSGSGVLLQPEAWPTAAPPWRFLPTWSGTGRFVEFTCLSLAATGVLIMSVSQRPSGPEESALARRFGGRLALVALLAWPPALLFTHLNLPAIGLSAGVWALAAVGLGVAGAAAWRVAGVPDATSPPPTRLLLGAAAALFCVLVASDHLARENALEEATLAGVVTPAAPRAPIEVAAAPAGKLAAGKAVFDRVCHLCHRFDAKVVGPPFNSVIPKYRSDPKALKAFIRNPVKKDPKYPVMPKPAVNETEIDAVAAYLLDQVKP
jgi:cytochrome c551/c552